MSEEKKKPVKKVVDRDLIAKLASIQCTNKEIAEVVGISEGALARRFGKVIEKNKQQGRQSLRRSQWQKAHDGDTRMMIFLGKQYLNQKDNPEDGEDKAPLPWED
jgi:AraC-like DNA-binding protein